METINTIPMISTKHFLWFKDTLTMSADASDVGFQPGFTPRTIILVNAKTNAKATFKMVLHDVNDTESLQWTYMPLDSSINVKVVIYND